MRSLLSRTLILLAVIGLVFTPPILTGYNELERANSAMDVGNFSDAADRYKRIICLLPWRNEMFEQIAIAQAYTGDYDSAILSFERARQHKALSDVGWDMLGVSYFQTGVLDLAAAA